MTRSIRPSIALPELTVLLVADGPAEASSASAGRARGRTEAVISLARAAFAVGGTVAVPVDADVSALLGTLALDYLQPRAAELRGEPSIPRVLVMETQYQSGPARQLLAPLAVRGAIRFLDQEGRETSLETSPETELHGLSDLTRQSVTSAMIDVVQPTFAVLVGAGRRTIDEVAILQENHVQTFNFHVSQGDETIAGSLIDMGVVDPSERLLGGTTPSPWAERDHRPDAQQPVPPYAYLMQRLVSERREG